MFPIAVQCDSLPIGPTVVKQEQYEAALQADQILARARAEAEEIRRNAIEEYERQKKQGYADGMDQANAESAQRMLGNVAETVAYFGSIETRFVEVICKSLRKILGDFNEQELVVRVARNALQWARNQSRVTLRVAPSQAEQLRGRVDDLLKNYPAIDVLDISADEHMQPSDCVLETEIGSVDASIDVQLEAIEKALKSSLHGNVEASEPNATVGDDSFQRPTDQMPMATADGAGEASIG